MANKTSMFSSCTNLRYEKTKEKKKQKNERNEVQKRKTLRTIVINIISYSNKTCIQYGCCHGKWRLNSFQRSLSDDLLRGISALPVEFRESRESRRGSSIKCSAGLG